MRPIVIAAPTEEPVTLAEAKKQVEVPSAVAAHDDHLISLIVAAREQLEKDTRRALITQTLELRLHEWPCTEYVELPKPPLASVTSVTYIDTNGVSQTWDSANYVVDVGYEPGRLYQAYSVSRPSVRCGPGAIKIRYVAGYGDADSVPQRAKQAILLLVGHWFLRREAVIVGTISKEIEHAYGALVNGLAYGGYP